ncbi:vitamin B12-dependent ribonucleotide reductase, partial [Candidatus Parcubacteria bacterium]
MIDVRDQVVSSAENAAKPASARRRGRISSTSSRRPRLGTRRGKGLKPWPVERVFSDPKVSPFDQVEWERRDAEITDDTGKVIFRQEGVEVPKSWSQLATKVVVSKYFYGELNTPERETSVRQLIHRVCRTIADWGVKDGYFSKKDGEVFYDELVWLCLNQYGAFNSPVWFNVGLYHQYGVGNESAQGNWHYNPATGEAERAPTQYEYPQC